MLLGILMMIIVGSMGLASAETPEYPKTYELAEDDVARYERTLEIVMANTAPETVAYYQTVAEKAAQSDEYIRNISKHLYVHGSEF